MNVQIESIGQLTNTSDFIIFYQHLKDPKINVIQDGSFQFLSADSAENPDDRILLKFTKTDHKSSLIKIGSLSIRNASESNMTLAIPMKFLLNKNVVTSGYVVSISKFGSSTNNVIERVSEPYYNREKARRLENRCRYCNSMPDCKITANDINWAFTDRSRNYKIIKIAMDNEIIYPDSNFSYSGPTLIRSLKFYYNSVIKFS